MKVSQPIGGHTPNQEKRQRESGTDLGNIWGLAREVGNEEVNEEGRLEVMEVGWDRGWGQAERRADREGGRELVS